MDKETLSNYGWIVICVLVLAVMLALATPFGKYVSDAVWSTTNGLFDVNNSAMGQVVTYNITDGADKIINPTTATELTFRVNMDISKFKGVKIDGVTVDEANYTASDNTVISFTTDYIRTLSLGTHTIEILADVGSAKADFKAADGWEVPEGGTYYVGATSNRVGDYTGATAVYNAGEFVKETPNGSHVFVLGDYEYKYNKSYIGDGGWGNESSLNGWGVSVLDDTKTEYGAILESVNNTSVKSLRRTFYKCSNLTIAPVVPNTTISMIETFYGCTNLHTAPIIPSSTTSLYETFRGCKSLNTYHGNTDEDGDFSNYAIPTGVANIYGTFMECELLTVAPTISHLDKVKNLKTTFQDCKSLIIAPTLPNNVTNMNNTFYNCSSLIVAPIIPSSVTNMQNTFSGCAKLKTYHGSTDADGDFSNYVIPSAVTNMIRTFTGCSLTVAPVIPSGVQDLTETFSNCYLLTIAPVIPSSVTNMTHTFSRCAKLKTYHGSTDADGDFSNYVIPNGVTSMRSTFLLCESLTTAPTIPNSVTDMGYTFYCCEALTGNIEINANPTSYSYCFYNTVKPLTIIGSCSNKAELAATALNKNVTVAP